MTVDTAQTLQNRPERRQRKLPREKGPTKMQRESREPSRSQENNAGGDNGDDDDDQPSRRNPCGNQGPRGTPANKRKSKREGNREDEHEDEGKTLTRLPLTQRHYFWLEVATHKWDNQCWYHCIC